MPVINLIMPKDDATLTFDAYNEDFRQFACKVHGNQRYGGLPYAYHLACVESVLTNYDFTDYEDRAVAWLHDVLEDTDVSFKELAQYYSPNIATYVEACTGRGKNRKERNASIYSKLEATPKAARYKVADRIANMKEGILTSSPKLGMYIGEFFEFSQVVRPLMTNDRKSLVMWNGLEGVVRDAMRLYSNMARAA